MDSDYRHALEWVNGYRQRAGWPLLGEFPNWRGCICPLEQALSLDPIAAGLRVTPESAWFASSVGIRRLDFPASVRAFIAKLDAGFYADLLETAAAPCPREGTHTMNCPEGFTALLARIRAMP